MSVIELCQKSIAISLPPIGRTILMRVWHTLVRRYRRGQHRHHLEGLNDHLLADIGLTRMDIDIAITTGQGPRDRCRSGSPQ